MLLYIRQTYYINMFQCHACYTDFDARGITANIQWFRKEKCPNCGCDIGIDFDPENFAPLDYKEPVVEDEPDLDEEVSSYIEQIDFNDFTVAELKEELTELGLSTKGKKSVLAKRLEEFLKEE
tara:strand:+ start:22 stop:390 length:369 start_codon:yes stop_codon:yes gene_type:complete